SRKSLAHRLRVSGQPRATLCPPCAGYGPGSASTPPVDQLGHVNLLAGLRDFPPESVMEYNPYQPSSASVHGAAGTFQGGVLSQAIISQLLRTRPWVRLLSVMSFLGA